MTGRIKLLKDGQPINPDDQPPIEYEYDTPGPYDETCGTYGLDEFQLPHKECPSTFVCDVTEAENKPFAECIDAMNCAMMAGMTTKMSSKSNIALFVHQMIPQYV